MRRFAAPNVPSRNNRWAPAVRRSVRARRNHSCRHANSAEQHHARDDQVHHRDRPERPCPSGSAGRSARRTPAAAGPASTASRRARRTAAPAAAASPAARPPRSPGSTTPIGRLIRKIHCQPMFSTSSPPTTGPVIVATPATAPHTLIGSPRFSGGNSRVMNDSVCGVIAAAPSPWTARAAISMPGVVASPLHSDAAGEDHQPGDEDPLGPEPVAEPAGQQQRDGVGQQVDAVDPDDLVEVRVEPGEHGRDRHGDDRGVEHDHEEARAQRPHRRPRASHGHPRVCRGRVSAPTRATHPGRAGAVRASANPGPTTATGPPVPSRRHRRPRAPRPTAVSAATSASSGLPRTTRSRGSRSYPRS